MYNIKKKPIHEMKHQLSRDPTKRRSQHLPQCAHCIRYTPPDLHTCPSTQRSCAARVSAARALWRTNTPTHVRTPLCSSRPRRDASSPPFSSSSSDRKLYSCEWCSIWSRSRKTSLCSLIRRKTKYTIHVNLISEHITVPSPEVRQVKRSPCTSDEQWFRTHLQYTFCYISKKYSW